MYHDLSRLPIQIDAEKVAAFCGDRDIARLSVFGSVVRDDFDPATSDVAVLADFKEPIVRREAVTIYEEPSDTTQPPKANDCNDLTADVSSSLDFWDTPLDDEWDRQIAADAAAGRLDHLIEEALADVAAGRCRPLEDLLAEESDEAGR